MTSELPGRIASGICTRMSLMALNRIIVEELNILEIIVSKVTVSVAVSRAPVTVERKHEEGQGLLLL